MDCENQSLGVRECYIWRRKKEEEKKKKKSRQAHWGSRQRTGCPNKIEIVRKELDCENQSLDTANQPKENDVMPLIQFRLATNDEIYDMLSKLAPKACGLDPVPTSLVKCHTDVLTLTITTIVNMSMQGFNPA